MKSSQWNSRPTRFESANLPADAEVCSLRRQAGIGGNAYGHDQLALLKPDDIAPQTWHAGNVKGVFRYNNQTIVPLPVEREAGTFYILDDAGRPRRARNVFDWQAWVEANPAA